MTPHSVTANFLIVAALRKFPTERAAVFDRWMRWRVQIPLA